MSKSEREYFFIVGQNRSGTSLLRNIINSSNEVSLADENNYFGHIFKSIGLSSKIKSNLKKHEYDEIIKKIYDEEVYRNFFYRNSAYWKWFKSKVSREEFLADLESNHFDEQLLFLYFIEKYNEENVSIVGDKTPDNFRYADQLYDLPGSVKVVHMVRNPKAVYSSEIVRRKHKKASELSTVLFLLKKLGLIRLFFIINVSLQYRRSLNYSKRNKKKYGQNYKVVRFEDLILDSANTVSDICKFIGIKYEDHFLDQHLVRNYSGKDERGIDESTINKYKKKLSSFECWVIDTLTI